MSTGADSTAVRTALWRALHTIVDAEPLILDDPLGLQIAGVGDDWRARPDMDPDRTMPNRASIVTRSRAVEDELARSGLRQYVLLGAGLDTFAQRHSGTVRVFEIDQPATQAWKRERLETLDLPLPTLVPVDFEAGDSWRDRVVAAGLDLGAPAFVSMLGVAMYLSPDALHDTLSQAASLASGSVMAFTTSRPIETAPPAIRPILAEASAGAAASGHPWLSLLGPDDAAALARGAGFSSVQVLTSQDLHDRYFAGRRDGLSPVGGEDLVIATV